MSTPWRHLTSGCEHECCSIARPGTLKPVLRDRSCDPRLKCEVAFRVPVHCQASAGPPPGLSCVFAGPAPVLCRASGPRRGPRRCHRHWCRQGSRRGLRPPPPRVFDDSCKTDRRRDLRDLRRNVFHQVRAESANNVRCAPEAIKQRSIAADHIFINCSQNIEHFGLCEKSCGFPTLMRHSVLVDLGRAAGPRQCQLIHPWDCYAAMGFPMLGAAGTGLRAIPERRGAAKPQTKCLPALETQSRPGRPATRDCSRAIKRKCVLNKTIRK